MALPPRLPASSQTCRICLFLLHATTTKDSNKLTHAASPYNTGRLCARSCTVPTHTACSPPRRSRRCATCSSVDMWIPGKKQKGRKTVKRKKHVIEYGKVKVKCSIVKYCETKRASTNTTETEPTRHPCQRLSGSVCVRRRLSFFRPTTQQCTHQSARTTSAMSLSNAMRKAGTAPSDAVADER